MIEQPGLSAPNATVFDSGGYSIAIKRYQRCPVCKKWRVVDPVRAPVRIRPRATG